MAAYQPCSQILTGDVKIDFFAVASLEIDSTGARMVSRYNHLYLARYIHLYRSNPPHTCRVTSHGTYSSDHIYCIYIMDVPRHNAIEHRLAQVPRVLEGLAVLVLIPNATWLIETTLRLLYIPSEPVAMGPVSNSAKVLL